MPELRRNLIRSLVLTLCAAMAVSAATITAAPPAQKARWKAGPIRLAISKTLLQAQTNIKWDSDVLSAISRAVEAWKSVADVEFVQVVSERESVSPVGLTGDGVSLITIAPTAENVLLFSTDFESAAKTRVFTDRYGYISEADIILSPFQQFSTDGSYGTFDLESTVKHEIGHLLGLRHSSVVGSVMYEVTSKNGVFGETSAAGGRLTDDDLTSIRDLYDNGDYEGCCGVLSGRIAGLNKNTASVELWLQEAISGRVIAHTSSVDGTFRIGGIDGGSYMLLARELGKSGSFATTPIAEVTIVNGQTATLVRKIDHPALDFSAELLGKNGILSDSPVKLLRGGTYGLYIGGQSLNTERVKLEIRSPFMSIDPDSLIDTAYDQNVSGLKFTLAIDVRTPPGDYNICAVSSMGTRDCIVGGIVVLSE